MGRDEGEGANLSTKSNIYKQNDFAFRWTARKIGGGGSGGGGGGREREREREY